MLVGIEVVFDVVEWVRFWRRYVRLVMVMGRREWNMIDVVGMF